MPPVRCLPRTVPDRVAEHLVATLREYRVPEAAIDQIGAAIAPLRPDVVTQVTCGHVRWDA
jgi:hypothetical protein